jgi:pimeloyl-ACP methyl ester carboxylesterase
MIYFKTLLVLLVALGCAVTALSRGYAEPSIEGRLEMPWSYENRPPYDGTFTVRYAKRGADDNPVALVMISDQHVRYGEGGAPETVFANLLQRYRATLYQFEPRGYNTPDRVNPHFYKYLTIENSVQDIETFITQVVLTHPKKHIVVIGTGYGGQLAAYYNAAFPRASAAVLDTAPVSTPVGYPLYSQTAVMIGQGCFQPWAEILAIFKAKVADGVVSRDMSFCNDVPQDDPEAEAFMWHSIFFPFHHFLSFNYNSKPYENAAHDLICSRLKAPAPHKAVYDEFREIVRNDLRAQNVHCLATDADSFAKQDFNGAFITRTVQQCLGLGQFATSRNDLGTLPVVITTDTLFKVCKTLLGDSYSPSVTIDGARRLVEKFGGTKYTGNNTIAANAFYDGYYELMPATAGDNSEVFMYYGRRGQLLALPSSSDTPDITAARVEVVKFLDSIIH